MKLEWSQQMMKLLLVYIRAQTPPQTGCGLSMAASPQSPSHQLCCVSQELSQLEERDIEDVMGMESILFVVEVSLI